MNVASEAKFGAIVAAAVLAGAGAATFALLRNGDAVPVGQSDVFSVDVGSGEVRNRTESEASEYLLSLSPDGRRVAFFAIEGRRSSLYVMEIDGESRRELASGGPAGGPLEGMRRPPAWSPDGKTIAFDRSRRCRDLGCDVWEVLLVEVDDGDVRRLVDEARGPTWSPDGTLVAFEGGVRGEGFGLTVDVIRPDGSARRRVAFGREPLWSPRGDLIAYERSGVRVIRPDGSGGRRLAAADEMESPFAWSHDGSRLAFALGEGEHQDLFWASVDGRQAGRLTRLRGSDANASWAPDGRRLTWSHELDLNETNGIPAGYLYLGTPNGAHPRRLVGELYRGFGDSAAWSRDGKQVLYTAHVGARVTADALDIHSVAVDGGTEDVLTTPMQESLPSASPDGRQLAFYADEETGSYLYVSDADGTARRRLAEGGDTESFTLPAPPAWSPDGRTVAFVRDFGCADRFCTTWEIWLVGADGSALRRLVSGGRGPSWSPDSGRIAYTGVDGYVYAVSVSGAGRRRLRAGSLPQWSPRGDLIAYVDHSTFPALRVVHPDGSEPRRLAEVETIGYAWSPDGRRLAIASFGSQPDQQIFVVDVETTSARPLVRQRGSDESPTFSPDGDRVAWVNLPSLEGEQRNFVYIARADGTGARRLTKRPQVIVDPLSWSANGRIYFTVWPRRSG